jgi:hypothetical protein
MKTKQLFVGIATACALLGLASSAALADGKSFPGIMCQASGSAQGLYYGAGALANRSTDTRSVVCPIVRDNLNAAASWIEIEVRDRHDTRDIQCTARSMPADGSAGGWQQTLSTTGTGFQTLTFTPVSAPPWGAYVITCSLPGMINNVPSYIATYRVLEP